MGALGTKNATENHYYQTGPVVAKDSRKKVNRKNLAIARSTDNLLGRISKRSGSRSSNDPENVGDFSKAYD